MKIDKVIFGCDDNPMYKDFWKITSKVCKTKLGVTPVLMHITDEDSEIYEDEYGLIKKIKKVNGINTGYQSQNVRMWGCGLFPDEVCLTSDIDMLMINKEYFIDSVKDFDDDAFIVYTSDAYQGNGARYPICYNASKGKNYKDILLCEDKFSDYITRLWKANKGWSFDEQYFTGKLKRSGFPNVILLKRGWGDDKIANRRIDRVKWTYDVDKINDYIDCHCIRPYSQHKEALDKLVDIICKSNKEG